MTHLEVESKLVLSEGDYHRLLAGGRVLERTEQLNVYLHDPGRIEEGEGYFRVRFESGREPVATLKIGAGWEGEVRRMVEVEGPLREMGAALFPRPRRRVPVEGLPAELGRHFQAMGITELRRLGWVRNRRTRLALPEGVVEVDRTTLPGGRAHHEVEIEGEDPERRGALAARIRELAPSARPTRVGKFTLFREAVRGTGR